jgi:glutaredoxin
MFVIRWLLGRIILLVNFLTLPKKPKRAPELQQLLDIRTADLALYQLEACPFCVKVRREIRRLGLNVSLKNIKQNEQHLQELIEQGGKRTVPCLRISSTEGQDVWLYESSKIIEYLQNLTAQQSELRQAA